MKHLVISLLWLVVMVGVCVGIDQLLLGVNMNSPVYTTTQTFYKDFRARLILLGKKEEHRLEGVKGSLPESIPEVVREKIDPLFKKVEATQGGYVYTDKEGGLHLTSDLEEVPKEYRAAAKPLQK